MTQPMMDLGVTRLSITTRIASLSKVVFFVTAYGFLFDAIRHLIPTVDPVQLARSLSLAAGMIALSVLIEQQRSPWIVWAAVMGVGANMIIADIAQEVWGFAGDFTWAISFVIATPLMLLLTEILDYIWGGLIAARLERFSPGNAPYLVNKFIGIYNAGAFNRETNRSNQRIRRVLAWGPLGSTIIPTVYWTLFIIGLAIAVLVPSAWGYIAVGVAWHLRHAMDLLDPPAATIRAAFGESGRVVFLRPFKEDERAANPKLASMFPGFKELQTEVICRDLWRIGQVSSIMLSRSDQQSHATGTSYDVVSDQDWQPHIEGLIRNSIMNVVVIGGSRGAQWEIDRIFDHGGSLGRTVFVVGKGRISRDRTAVAETWQRLTAHHGSPISSAFDPSTIAFGVTANNVLWRVRSSVNWTTAYQAAVRIGVVLSVRPKFNPWRVRSDSE